MADHADAFVGGMKDEGSAVKGAPIADEIDRAEDSGVDPDIVHFKSVLRQCAKSGKKPQLFRELRAENTIWLLFGKGRDVRYRHKFENRDVTTAFMTAMLYASHNDEAIDGLFSSPGVSKAIVPQAVKRDCCWWTPCGLYLWCVPAPPEAPLFEPCYLCQDITAYGCLFPCTVCMAVTYAACILPNLGGLAAKGHADEQKQFEEMIDAAQEDSDASLKEHPDWEYDTNRASVTEQEIVLCALLSQTSYAPTTDKPRTKIDKEMSMYQNFVPLKRELYIEHRADKLKADGGGDAAYGQAIAPLVAFEKMFYSPTDRDPESGEYGMMKPLMKLLDEGEELIHGFDVPKTDTQGFIVRVNSKVHVVFRGTTTGRDWKNNARGIWKNQVEFMPDKCEAHRGFLEAFMSVMDIMVEHVLPDAKEGKEIVITGHSMGGALATLGLAWLMTHPEVNDKCKVLCVTFGAPKVGNEEFCDLVDKIRRDNRDRFRTVRLHNEKDPIVSVPPHMLGYRHCMRRAIITTKGQIYFPDDESRKALMDQTTVAFWNLLSDGSDVLGAHHNIFCYFQETVDLMVKNAKAP